MTKGELIHAATPYSTTSFAPTATGGQTNYQYTAWSSMASTVLCIEKSIYCSDCPEELKQEIYVLASGRPEKYSLSEQGFEIAVRMWNLQQGNEVAFPPLQNKQSQSLPSDQQTARQTGRPSKNKSKRRAVSDDEAEEAMLDREIANNRKRSLYTNSSIHAPEYTPTMLDGSQDAETCSSGPRSWQVSDPARYITM